MLEIDRLVLQIKRYQSQIPPEVKSSASGKENNDEISVCLEDVERNRFSPPLFRRSLVMIVQNLACVCVRCPRHILAVLSEAVEGLHGLDETALYDKLRAYIPDIESFFEENFQKAAKGVLGIAGKTFHSLDSKSIAQLNTILQVDLLHFSFCFLSFLTSCFLFFFSVGVRLVPRKWIEATFKRS